MAIKDNQTITMRFKIRKAPGFDASFGNQFGKILVAGFSFINYNIPAF